MLAGKLKSNPLILYSLMIILGVAAGLSDIQILQSSGQMISDIFIRIFKCISIPVIALSIIVTLSSHASASMNNVLKRTAF